MNKTHWLLRMFFANSTDGRPALNGNELDHMPFNVLTLLAHERPSNRKCDGDLFNEDNYALINRIREE